MSVLEPIIRDWCKRSGYGLGKDAMGSNAVCSGQESLSELSGVSIKRIRAILAGGCHDRSHGKPHFSTRVSFDTADRLLCAMDQVSAWQHELAEWYGPIRVAGYEKDFLQPVEEGCAA